MSKALEILQRSRDVILLTEIVGWLHDIDKLDENHQLRVGKKPIRHTRRVSVELGFEKRSESDEDAVYLDKKIIDVFHQNKYIISYPELSYGLDEPAVGTPLFRHHSDNPPKNTWEIIFAHTDSKDSEEDRSNVSDKEYCSGYRSNPFGFEIEIKPNIREKRKELYEKIAELIFNYENYYNLKNILQEYFGVVVADTRRSANDISLWDHGFMTGAISKCILIDILFKSKQGKWFLQESKEYLDLQKNLEEAKTKKEKKEIGKKISRIGKKLKEGMTFRSLVVALNGISFLTNVYRLSDQIGREYIFTRIREGIKELLEVEIPIGSVIYEDINTLTFLVPELDDDTWKELKTELENKLNEKILDILRSELTLDDKNVSNLLIQLNPSFIVHHPPEKEVSKLMIKGLQESNKKVKSRAFSETTITLLPLLSKAWSIRRDKCQVCGLLPATEEDRGDKLCKSCYVLRAWGRFKTKEENKKLIAEGKTPASIWLDEIKDDNNLLALIVGKISPIEKWLESKSNGYIENSTYIRKGKKKKLSASRARAVWRTIDNFCRDCIKLPEQVVDVAYGCVWNFDKSGIELLPSEIKNKLKNNPNIDIIFNNKRISAYLHYPSARIETIEGLDRELAEDLSKTNELMVKYRRFKFTISVSECELKSFYKYRPIYSYAGEFAIIVPANKALKICKEIKKKFEKEFGKVLGRLTLNLGIIFFKHKMPLYITLESGRRMINNFHILSSKERYVEIKKIEKTSDGYELTLSYLNKELKWLIYSKFPDGTNDIYYPYLFTKDNVEPKHISEISENEILKVYLNYFDYEYLVSSHDRFRIYLCSETEKRIHPLLGKYSPRPYLLEDIEKIIELWEILSNRLTKSQIKKLEYVCASKIREWNLGDKNIADNFKFKEFVTSFVENICGNLDDNTKQVIISSILSGMFFDVIELFMTLESEIGGDKNE